MSCLRPPTNNPFYPLVRYVFVLRQFSHHLSITVPSVCHAVNWFETFTYNLIDSESRNDELEIRVAGPQGTRMSIHHGHESKMDTHTIRRKKSIFPGNMSQFCFCPFPQKRRGCNMGRLRFSILGCDWRCAAIAIGRWKIPLGKVYREALSVRETNRWSINWPETHFVIGLLV